MEHKSRIINPRFPYTYRRTLLAMERLLERYPGIVRKERSGRSEQGRDIPAITLGTGNVKTLAVGAVHGREYVTVGFLLLCAEEYAQAYYAQENYGGFDVKKILTKNTLHIVPVSNPDGVEIALGRALPEKPEKNHTAYTYKNNGNNINLNANFPFLWDDVPTCRQGGKEAASERETRFLMNLCESYNYKKMLSFHSRGDCLYWRDLGNGEISGDKVLAEKLRDVCGFSLCEPTQKRQDYAGGFENWFRYRFRKPAICVELIKDENAPFDLCCSSFYTYTRWVRTRYALLAAMDD